MGHFSENSDGKMQCGLDGAGEDNTWNTTTWFVTWPATICRRCSVISFSICVSTYKKREREREKLKRLFSTVKTASKCRGLSGCLEFHLKATQQVKDIRVLKWDYFLFPFEFQHKILSGVFTVPPPV